MSDLTLSDEQQAALQALAQNPPPDSSGLTDPDQLPQLSPPDQNPITQAFAQAAADNGQAPAPTLPPDQAASAGGSATPPPAPTTPAPTPPPDQTAPGATPPDQSAPAPTPATPPPPTVAPPTAPAPGAAPTTPGAATTPAPNPATTGSAGSPGNWSAYNARLSMMESGNKDITNPNSSASGIYQITNPTYQALVAKHPELQGLSKNDPKVIDALNNDNASYLKGALGHDPSMVEMYAAHFFGPAGAVKFLTALQADPNTLAKDVALPGQVAANRGVFFNPDGSAKTVGQLYNGVAARMGSDTLLAGQGTGGGGTGTVNPFDRQQSAVEDWIKSQPAMWQKLQDLQSKYQAASKPSMWDNLQDAFNAYGQAHAAAVANEHASTGGELLHSSPDATPFIGALKAGQDQLNAQRAIIQNRAKTALDSGSALMMAQMQQGGQNLGLTGDLAKNQAANTIAQQNLGLEQQKIALELAKFNQSANQQIISDLDKQVTNLPVKSAIIADFNQQNSPQSTIQQQQQLMSSIIAKHAGDPGGLVGKLPEQPYNLEYRTPDPDHPGQFIGGSELVDLSTPEGKQRQAELQAKYSQYGPVIATSPAKPTITIGGPSISTGNQSGEGGKTLTPGQQYGALQKVTATAQAVNQLLDMMKDRNMSTGPLTMSPTGQHVAALVQQLTGSDPSNLNLQQTLNLVLTQLGNDITLPQLKGLGRSTEVEFNRIGQGVAAGTLTTDSIRSSMSQILSNTQDEMKKIKYINDRTQADLNKGVLHPNTNGYEMEYYDQPGYVHPQQFDPSLLTPKSAPAAPALPPGVPPGSVYSRSRNAWRGPDGTIYPGEALNGR